MFGGIGYLLYLCSTKKGAKLLTLKGTNAKAPALVSQRTTGAHTKNNQRKGMKTIQAEQTAYTTTYAVAASWSGCTTILCNEIAYIDEDLMLNTIGYECDEDTDEYPEIYQYYITNCSDDLCEFLNEHFGLMFAYSEMLGLWVLLVDHYGTGWDYVAVDTDLPAAAAPLATRRIN